jgi:hypothetical protein
MPITYEPIASTTLTGASTSVVFSSIPQTYTDLVFVFTGFNINATAMDFEWEANGDSGNNYSETGLQGDGTTVSSFQHNNYSGGIIGSIWSTGRATVIGNFMNYSNTTTFKTCMGRFSTPSGALVGYTASMWRNTSAITSLNFNQPSGQSGQFATGSTFTLYGIKAA